MGKEFAYRKLDVYHKALVWVIDVYKIVTEFPLFEDYALSSQLRRAAISVTSNIAEGMSRSSNKDVVRFLEISYGSLMEANSQLEIAQLLGYIDKNELDDICGRTMEIARMLSGLKNSISNSGK
ncbi:MAG: four helix bundle protein [Rikenellaceae bacterium]|nr:four helix bundle protein [Rikenellaceae bacterium]